MVDNWPACRDLSVTSSRRVNIEISEELMALVTAGQIQPMIVQSRGTRTGSAGKVEHLLVLTNLATSAVVMR